MLRAIRGIIARRSSRCGKRKARDRSDFDGKCPRRRRHSTYPAPVERTNRSRVRPDRRSLHDCPAASPTNDRRAVLPAQRRFDRKVLPLPVRSAFTEALKVQPKSSDTIDTFRAGPSPARFGHQAGLVARLPDVAPAPVGDTPDPVAPGSTTPPMPMPATLKPATRAALTAPACAAGAPGARPTACAAPRRGRRSRRLPRSGTRTRHQRQHLDLRRAAIRYLPLHRRTAGPHCRGARH
jgi:hypothetical protein